MPSKKTKPLSRSRRGREAGRVAILLEALSAANKDVQKRERAFKELMRLAEDHPDDLLPHWTQIAGLLKGGNAFSRYPAVFLVAALVRADAGRRFEKTLPDFVALLDDENISVAAHVAALSGKIVRAVPRLENRITRRLLEVESTHFNKSRKDLLKAYVVEAFGEYFAHTKSKKAILTFVRDQLASGSPKARKAAKVFLQKWAPGDR
jgi:hypothetical protein